MLAPNLAEVALPVLPPGAWLGELAPGATTRLDRRTPRELRRMVRRALVRGTDPSTASWVLTRQLDGQAHPPLRADDALELGAWVVEFSFGRRSWLAALFGVGPRAGFAFRALEARARAFVDADLREVEQWSLDGLPEVAVTVGRAGRVAVEAQAARGR